MYAEFSFRMQNPASPQRLCFSIDQWYSKKRPTASRRSSSGVARQRDAGFLHRRGEQLT